MGFGIWDLGFGIWDLGFGIWDLGLRQAQADVMLSEVEAWDLALPAMLKKKKPRSLRALSSK